MAREANTRERIQQVALELFTERGYDGTSLREIAERLGVTKAALYYHFASKDAILLSLVTGMKERIEGLVAWGREQSPDEAFRRELLSRLADLVYGDATKIVRLIQENQPVVRGLGHEEGQSPEEPGKWVFDLAELLTPQGADLYRRTRIQTAIITLVFGAMAGERYPFGYSKEERKNAALRVAEELI